MIETTSGATFTAVAEDADPGLVGTIGVAIEDADANVISARTTDGIVEVAPGVYVKDDLVAPNDPGTFLVIWDDETDFASEELVVSASFSTAVGGGGGILSDFDVAGMRRVLETSLPDVAVIHTNTFTSDSGGGGTSAWTVAGTFPCRVSPSGIVSGAYGREIEIGSRLASDADWIITLPAETPIDTDNRIAVGSRTFNVVALHAPHSYELSRRVKGNEVE
jgi:head-tail adaptor